MQLKIVSILITFDSLVGQLSHVQKAFSHFRYRSNARRLSQWAERRQPTSCRQSADVFNDGSPASEPNARQDIRHLRLRCDAERLASMGRAESED